MNLVARFPYHPILHDACCSPTVSFSENRQCLHVHCYPEQNSYNMQSEKRVIWKSREGTFFIEGGGPGYLRIFFCEKRRGSPTPWNGLMHDPSEIPKQEHLTLPSPLLSKTKITRSENNKLEVLLM